MSILRGLVPQDDVKKVQEEWRRYRQHASKNVFWLLPKLVSEGARRLEDFGAMLEDKENSQLLDNVKQLAFYTDSYGKCRWSAPIKVIDKKLAESILDIARLLIRPEKAFVTELELEIWIKHMKPALKADTVRSKEALLNCYEELEQVGLIEKGGAEYMRQFALFDGIKI